MSISIGYSQQTELDLLESLRPAAPLSRFRFAVDDDLSSLETGSRLAATALRPELSNQDRAFLAAVAAELSSPAVPVAVKTRRRRKVAEPTPSTAPQLGMPALLAGYAREFYLGKPLSLTEIAKSIEREMVKNFVDAPEAERQKRRATMESIRRYDKFKPLKYRRIMDLIGHVFAVQ
ncbi:hypothetical protein [Rhizobium esperanzae]|uniref:Uncharacterized protein n=1 Tax=Rhizobium esperanzae TaxID=1967781 RepID=A0A7W6R4Q0_9HYPH|nr:hypothetical protein [Rhizobium esperanzae]MBB4236657.1 hypothetical protein [Rhizobium esperanzae]